MITRIIAVDTGEATMVIPTLGLALAEVAVVSDEDLAVDVLVVSDEVALEAALGVDVLEASDVAALDVADSVAALEAA